MLDLKTIDRSWTLFLDRDGVINYEKYQGYIYTYSEFLFLEGVPEAIKILSQLFGKIIITTNQRGVGKGLMSEEDLNIIHRNMLMDIEKAGGRIDKIYYCSAIDDSHPRRKPNPGMIIEAKAEFPEIVLDKSIIAGNKLSDMEFGRNAGIHTIFIKSTDPDQALPHPLVDAAFDSLADLAKALQKR